MGNQLTGQVPNEILSVDRYLVDVADHRFDSNLGSTRFLKVAKTKHREGPCVIKVFVIADHSIPIKQYKVRIDAIRENLTNASNCLAFHRTTLSEKAGLMFRQYFAHNLFDRLSTRPFLTAIEKKWICFQLLCGLNQCHKSDVCHGDLKTENVLLTSWNWVVLTDFASYKPTFLPENNPTDFNFYFDTSRSRTCYIAPERFVRLTSTSNDISDLITDNDSLKDPLVPTMDVFSLGCIIVEVFTEGMRLFDLSQLLAYRADDSTYDPWDVIQHIQDADIRNLAAHMIQKNPEDRHPAELYLLEERGRSFPEYFYNFLQTYMSGFATNPIMSADEKVLRVYKDFNRIKQSIAHVDDKSDGLCLVSSVLTSCYRNLCFPATKLKGLHLLWQLSLSVASASLILDRIVPYVLSFFSDLYSHVRCEAIRTLCKCLRCVEEVPLSDVNVFPEYIFPAVSQLSRDSVSAVRMALAETIAELAEISTRFLDYSYLYKNRGESSSETGLIYAAHTSYDIDRQNLHRIVQIIISNILHDQVNAVKITLLQKGTIKLCTFFGRSLTDDVLLARMIPFLNDKQDWQLRAAFYDAVVLISTYSGSTSCRMVAPLLHQGLRDAEEFVIEKTIFTISVLADLNLLEEFIYKFIEEIAPFLCHPNLYLRHSAVEFICNASKHIHISLLHSKVLPLIHHILVSPIVLLSEPISLISKLKSPIARDLYDYILKSNQVEPLMALLVKRQLKRNNKETNNSASDDSLQHFFSKLQMIGISDDIEDILLFLKDVMVQIHKSRLVCFTDSAQSDDDSQIPGYINLASMTKKPRTISLKGKEKVKSQKKKDKFETNKEWQIMFGGKISSNSDTVSDSESRMFRSPTAQSVVMSDLESKEIDTKHATPIPAVVDVVKTPHKVIMHTHYFQCYRQLQKLVEKKQKEFEEISLKREIIDVLGDDTRKPPLGWRPRGNLVAHMREHQAAVNCLKVREDHQFFATCSDDNTVKLWNTSLVDGTGQKICKSRATYSRGGDKDFRVKVKCLTWCQGQHSIAAAATDGSIHVIQAAESYLSLAQTRQMDLDDEGCVTDMSHMNTGSQSILVYSTVNGQLTGWDLRSSGSCAWRLQNKLQYGLITALAVDPKQCWIAVGTSSGVLVCWDLRFQLPIADLQHPMAARVRKISIHPVHQASVIASFQGNNEVSSWNFENSSRYMTLWASKIPALSTTQVSTDSVQGMYIDYSEDHPYILTGGSDSRVRFWDLGCPESSSTVVHATTDSADSESVSYKEQLIDGTKVIQEVRSYTRGSSRISDNDLHRPLKDCAAPGHHDCISDLAVANRKDKEGSCILITASRDGVVKTWK